MDETVKDGALLLGRLLLAALFIVEGVSKMSGYQAAVLYMQHFSIPTAFLPLAITVEVTVGRNRGRTNSARPVTSQARSTSSRGYE